MANGQPPPGMHTPADALALFMNLSGQRPLGLTEAPTIRQGCVEALEKAAKTIEDEAKRVIGTYEYGWEPLKPATIARKVHGDTPLYETGVLQDSIEHHVDPDNLTAQVGSNDPTAEWQELGTSRGIPPRSFLMGAAMVKEKEITEQTGVHIHGLILKQMT